MFSAYNCDVKVNAGEKDRVHFKYFFASRCDCGGKKMNLTPFTLAFYARCTTTRPGDRR